MFENHLKIKESGLEKLNYLRESISLLPEHLLTNAWLAEIEIKSRQLEREIADIKKVIAELKAYDGNGANND